MTIDVTTITYSDAMVYLEDYLSDSPIFGVTEDDFYAITLNFNLDTIPYQAPPSRLLI